MRQKNPFQASSLKKPEDATGFWLWRCTMSYQRSVDLAFKGTGITHLQFAVLVTIAWLGRSREEVSQRQICQHSGIQEAQVSLMIKALKKKKLISQRPSATDSRVRTCELLPEGSEVLEKSLRAMAKLQASLWPNEQERSLFGAQLKRNLERWEKL